MPRRRCVGCGRVAPKPELIRIAVARDGHDGQARAVLDATGTRGGRGAYVCRGPLLSQPAPTCMARAAAGRALARTLRCPVTIPPELIESGSR